MLRAHGHVAACSAMPTLLPVNMPSLGNMHRRPRRLITYQHQNHSPASGYHILTSRMIAACRSYCCLLSCLRHDPHVEQRRMGVASAALARPPRMQHTCWLGCRWSTQAMASVLQLNSSVRRSLQLHHCAPRAPSRPSRASTHLGRATTRPAGNLALRRARNQPPTPSTVRHYYLPSSAYSARNAQFLSTYGNTHSRAGVVAHARHSATGYGRTSPEWKMVMNCRTWEDDEDGCKFLEGVRAWERRDRNGVLVGLKVYGWVDEEAGGLQGLFEARKWGQELANLEQLELGGMRNMKDDGMGAVAELGKGMPKLHTLEFICCPRVSTAVFMELVEQGAKSWPLLNSFTYDGETVGRWRPYRLHSYQPEAGLEDETVWDFAEYAQAHAIWPRLERLQLTGMHYSAVFDEGTADVDTSGHDKMLDCAKSVWPRLLELDLDDDLERVCASAVEHARWEYGDLIEMEVEGYD
jgi:hypothetical protein